MTKLSSLYGLLAALLFACQSEGADPAPGPAAPADPVQYGTPFADVPEARNATVYQVNMRAFSSAGTFAGVQARLDSIQALGINVLYLMPIHPVGKLRAFDSPYAVQDYTAVNPEFGTLADLRALVAAAHARRMAVVLDWVSNHTAWDNPWITAHKDWYRQDAAGTILNPSPFSDVAQLNFDSSPMRAEMIRALRYWVFEANIDGYRFDYADNQPQEFFTQALTSLNSIGTHRLLLIAEGSANRSYYQAGFGLCYGFDFVSTLKDQVFAGGQSVRQLDVLTAANYQNAPAAYRVLRYTSNHDLNAYDGTPLEFFGGVQGSLAAFVVAAYQQAAPMVYNGQEVACPVRLPFMGPRKVIDWTLNPAVTKEYRKILRFRNGSAAVRSGMLTPYSSDDVCAFTKTAGAEQVLVLANLRNRVVSYPVPAALPATWRHAFDGQPLTLGGTLTLQPYQYLVLRN
ncbi:alpha-amylase family glycosyl hydrolase [Hymenobacter algoricola]|uniref:Alpha-amylase family glycosyl hydrolase n=1 Tax=Hymenobacter algoricola TaxID=486267 RepID=A0ABP7NH95_9BACT